jgi:predicted Zn-dependent protease
MMKARRLLCLLSFVFLFFACETFSQITSSIGTAASGLISDDAGAGWAQFGSALGKAFEELTPENEYYIGRAVAANIATNYKVDASNKALQTYLNKICTALTLNSPKPEIYNGYHVAVLNTTEINALSTSGGHIFITKGLLACTSTEDEIASVLAHEIAHIQLQHSLKAIKNARFVNAATTGISAAAGTLNETKSIFNDSVQESVNAMVTNGYGQSQEFDADSLAIALLQSAGYEPTSILGMLETLKKNQKTGEAGYGKTHPTPESRITNVNKSIGKYQVEDTTQYRKARYAAVKK